MSLVTDSFAATEGQAPVLVVDDSPANVKLLETALEPLGQPVVCALSGAEALAAAAEQTFAVVLLDVQMPEMDGFEVASRLQSLVGDQAPAVIFVTALQFQEEHVRRGYSLGAIDYLIKPVSLGILRAKVEAFIAMHLQRRALAAALARATAAERRLAKRNAELKRSNEDLERFAYVASHDLKEPLRMVTSYVELLGRRYRGRLDDKADRFIGFATEGAERMRTLIDDLLEYSRVGTCGRDLEPTDVESVLARVLRDLEVAVRESSATVTHDPLPTVAADEGQLRQLLQNLIANAIKFRGATAPAVHVGAEPLDAAGDVPGLGDADRCAGGWLLSVRDDGIGIDAAFADEVFQIFRRLHGRGDYAGTGIGLAVCRRIVERHGGRIWVDSEPGRGSTFYFTLPASADPSREQERADVRAQEPIAHAAQS